MLRQLLIDDFKIDLPISGGTGQSIGDPIVIETQHKHVASRAEMDILRCINKQLGRHWRLVGKVRINDDLNCDIEKVSFEAKYPEGDEVITDTRNFYFDISALNLDEDKTTPTCYVSVGEDGRFNVPYQLGWVNFTNSIDNEAVQAGAGLSVAYDAPCNKVTVFIYDKALAVIDPVIAPALLDDEFSKAKADILTRNPQAKQINSVSEDNFRFSAFDIDGDYSAVMLGIKENNFVKTRATMFETKEQYVFTCLMESLTAITALTNS